MRYGFSYDDIGIAVSVDDAYAVAVCELSQSSLAMAVDARAQWSLTEYMLAQVIDELRALQYVTAGSKKNKKPEPIERPKKVEKSAFVGISLEEAIERWKPGGGYR